MKYVSNFIYYIRFIKKETKLSLIFFFILNFFNILFDILSIGSIYPLLNSIMSTKSFFLDQYLERFGLIFHNQKIVIYTMIFGIILIISNILRFSNLYFQNKIYYLASFDINSKLFKNFLSLDISQFKSKSSSKIISSILAKNNAVSKLVLLPVIVLITNSIFFFCIFVVILIINKIVYLLICICIILFYSLIVYFSNGIITKISTSLNEEQTKLFRFLSQSFSNFKDIKVYNLQNYFLDKFNTSELKFKRSSFISSMLSIFPRFALEIILLIFVCIIIIHYQYSEKVIDELIPLLGIALVASYKLMPIAHSSYNSLINIKSNMENLIEINSHLKNYTKYENIKKINLKNITLDKISFGYENLLFKNVDLIINAGDRIAIWGKSGTGKSTLVDLIAGYIKPNSGRILVNGTEIDFEKYNSFLTNFCTISQHSTLFEGSILYNICLDKKKNEEKLKQAVKTSNLYEDFKLFSINLDTLVGENGSKLSGGQIKRVLIARAIYSGKRILILDEVTSGLDEKSNRQIMNTIFNLDKRITIIFITHNKKNLQFSNKIYELKNQKILRIFPKKKETPTNF